MTFFRGGAARVVGHRGGRGPGWPAENTLDAFERAAQEGALAVETDARLLATGEVILLHDPTLDASTRGEDRRAIAAMSLAEASGVRLDGGLRMPLLADALAWARDRGVAMNVEIKSDGERSLRLAAAVARALSRARADVLVSSFHPAPLAAIAALAPGVPRAWLTHPRHDAALDLTSRAARAEVVRALHPERTQVSPARVARWKRRGLLVGVYTVNDDDEARALAAAGVDWIITDRPGAILRALRPST